MGDLPSFELTGVVRGPDFDVHGNTGVVVALSEESREAIEDLGLDLPATAPAPVTPAPGARIARTPAPLGPATGTSASASASKPAPAASAAPAALPASSGGPAPGTSSTRPQGPDAARELLLAPGATIDGRFRIEAHIASGGMGDVYRANHIHLKRAVALKLLKRSLASDAGMWSRFQREAELVSQLESAHVVRVFDFGRTEDGQPYIAMEFVEGITLDEALAEGPLRPDRAVEVLTQVCDGLAEAHALGVIHRDLKPANLILGHRRDGTEVVKILDFGIARLADAHEQGDSRKLTQTGLVVGTPAYLAPEQALADELDVRTDVYALGCVAYELLTGRPPFVSEDLAKVIVAHITQSPEPPEHLRPELLAYPELGAAVLKALEKDRVKRFASASEFARALASAVVVQSARPGPPLATPPPDAPSLPRVTRSPLATLDDLQALDPARLPPVNRAPEDDLWPPHAPEPSAPALSVPRASSPTPAPSAPSHVDAAALSDFFGDEGAAPDAADGAPPEVRPPVADALTGLAPPAVLAALRLHAGLDVKRAAHAFVEVLGVARGSDAGKWCQAQLLAVTAAFGGSVAQLDEDGLVLAFAAQVRVPVHRAAGALFAIAEAVSLEARRLGVTARVRAALITAEVRRGDARGRGPDVLDRARALLGRVQAGQVVVERGLVPELQGAFEVSSAPGGDAVQLTTRRPSSRKAAPPELVGRGPVLEVLERRLQSLAQGAAAPLLVRGAPGAGKSALAVEVTARARKRGLAMVVATAFPSWKRLPGSAATGLLCAALGVPFDTRSRALPPALEALALPASQAEAVLVAAGLTQPSWAFTAGQLVQAVRAVVKAVHGGKPVVLVLDGMEHLDDVSLDLVAELAAHPAPRELVLGFAASGLAAERVAGCAVSDLPALTPAEVRRLAAGVLGAPPGPRLSALLDERAQGAPGNLLDWLGLLEDRGSLSAAAGALELDDDPPQLDAAGLSAARVRVLPADVQRVLEAAACQGETFDAGAITAAWPRVSQPALQRAVATRLLTPLAGRRWSFSSARVLQAVLASPSPERMAMHGRLAQAMVVQGKANPASVDPVQAGAHFLASGDGASAAALFQHAAEVALARRAPRDVVTAQQGLSAALAATRQPELVLPRLQWLARAAGTALALQDGRQARALVDEATRAAEAAKVECDELALSLARVMRSEARRSRAAEALGRAEALVGSGPLKALVEVERGESREQEGDLVGAMVAYEAALVGAEAAAPFSRWHGEVDLVARLEARLGALSLQRKDSTAARRLFESSARRWRAAAVPAAEARALANLGTTAALAKDHPFAATCFKGAAEAAARAGDLLFQARCLLQQAKALKKTDGQGTALKAIATEARRLSEAVAWDMGQLEAAALLG